MSELSKLRAEIDRIDDEIFELLVKRFDAAKQISSIKTKTNAPSLDPDRWRAIEERIKAQAQQASLDKEAVLKIYRAIHEYVLNKIHRS